MFRKLSFLFLLMTVLPYSGSLFAQAEINVWETHFEDGFEVDFAWPNWGRRTDTHNYTWDDTDYKAASGETSVWCVYRSEGAFPELDPAKDNYPNNVDAWMWVLEAFDTRDCAEAELSFDVLHQLSDTDYLQIKAQTGDGVWKNMTITGNNWDFETVRYEFSDWNSANLLGHANVTVAFRFVSNASGNAKGVFLDNVKFRKYFSGRPDIAIPEITFSPSNQPPGGLIQVSAKLENQGSYLTEIPTTVQYYLSADNIIDPDEDVLIGHEPTEKILEDASKTFSRYCLLPKDLTYGEYYIGAYFDPDTLVAELDRSNNYGVAVSKLVIGDESTEWEVIFSEDFESGMLDNSKWMSYPGAGSGHYSFDSTDYVAYVGDFSGWCAARPHDGYPNWDPVYNNLPACNADYCESYLIINKPIDMRNVDDVQVILMGNIMSGALQIVAAPGSDYQGDTFSNLTYGWDQYVYSLLDWPVHGSFAGHAAVRVGVKHTSTTAGKGVFIDNFVIRKKLPPQPDLTVDPLVLPAAVYAGKSMSIQATVKNIGKAASPVSSVSFYLSKDDTIRPSDDVFIGKLEVDALGINESQILIMDYLIPEAMADETWIVGTLLDSADVVDENVENNNITTAEVTFLNPWWTLTVGTNPAGLNYTVMGKLTNVMKKYWQPVDQYIEVSTDSLIALNDSVRYRFTQWSDGGIRTHRLYTETHPDTVIAQFVMQYKLNILSDQDTLIGDDTGWYDQGSTISLKTVATVPQGDTTQYVFNGWTGAYTGSDTTGSFVLSAPATVWANWKTQHYLALSVNPANGGNIIPAPPGAWYDAGVEVIVEAVPDTLNNYQLDGWTGDLTGSVNPETVTMNSPKSVIANFKVVIPDWTITVGANHASASYYIDGGLRTTMRTFTWPVPVAHRLGADSLITINETSRLIFVKWSDGSHELNRIISAGAQPDTVIAQYRVEYRFNLSAQYGTVSGDTTGWYTKGSTVHFTADSSVVIGNLRQVFQQWSGDYNGQNYQGSLVMNAPKTVTAAAWKLQYRLRLTSQPENGGELSPKTPGGWYDVNKEVILSALPASASGFYFKEWSGSLSSTDNPVKIKMDTVKHITAQFELPATSWKLTIQSNHVKGRYFIDNTLYDSTGTFQWPIAQNHTVKADSLISLGAGSRLRFLSWSNSKARIHQVKSSDGLDTLTAQYQLEYEFKLSAAHGTLSGNPSGWYVAGTTMNFSVDSLATTGLMRWVFLGWTGDYTQNVSRGSLLLDGSKTVGSNWRQQFRLSLSITPAGRGETSPALPGRWYNTGTEVILSALPDKDAGYVFHAWSGDYSGNLNPVKIKMDSAITVQAAFIIPDETWYLTVMTNPPSGQYSVNTVLYDSTHTFTCPTDDEYIVSADSFITLGSGRRLHFVNWSDGGLPIHIVECSDGMDTLIANYQQEYLLSLKVDRGSTAGNSATWYPADTTVSLIADSIVQSDNVRWQFAGWTGDYTGKNPNASVIMNTQRQIGTSWNKQYWLELSIEPETGGEISPPIPGGWFDMDEEVILSALPNEADSYGFTGWLGDTTSAANPIKIKMDTPKSVTAKFEIKSAVDAVEIPTEYALHQNHPNPFNPSTTIRYAIPKSGHVEIEIYNIMGSRVKTLVNMEREPGTYMAVWDGTDQNGNHVSSGTYLYIMQSGDYQKKLKALFMK